MDVAEFYQWVRSTLNRGTTLDNVIPHYIRAAVREIENIDSFHQLEWWATFSLTTSDDPIISLPDRLKEIKFIRYDVSDAGKRAKWVYLTETSPRQLISRVGLPERYWMKGRQLAVLDAELSEDLDFEIKALRYSEVPDESAGDGVSHWLIDAIPAALHARVMLLMSDFMREDNPNMIQLRRQLYQEGVTLLQDENAHAEAANAPTVMEYWPEHIPFDKAFADNEE